MKLIFFFTCHGLVHMACFVSELDLILQQWILRQLVALVDGKEGEPWSQSSVEIRIILEYHNFIYNLITKTI
jgi:hypothetical protein